MIISEKILKHYFKNIDSIKVISEKLNEAGIINTLRDARLHIEYPTIRPDCNSLLGIFIEISSVARCEFIYDVENFNNLEKKLLPETTSSYCVGTIRKDFWEKFPDSIHTLVLKDNNMFEKIKYDNFRNYCSLMYGVIPFFLPDFIRIEDVKKEYPVVYEKDNEYFVRFSSCGEEYSVMTQLTGNNLNIFTPILNPVVAKRYLDTKKTVKGSLYYNFIRGGNEWFANVMYNDICDKNYVLSGNNSYNVFSIQLEKLINEIYYILGIKCDIKEVLNILKPFGYMFEKGWVFAPKWRKDIVGIQDVVNDVFRRLDINLKGEPEVENSFLQRYISVGNLEEKFANYGFTQIMSRPFVSVDEANIMERIYGDDFVSIKLLNPYSNSKPYIQCSNYCNCIRARKKYNKCFETSIVKRNQNGVYTEESVISWNLDLVNEEKCSFFVEEIWSIFTDFNRFSINCISEMGRTVWQVKQEKEYLMILVFDYFDTNKIRLFGELNTDMFLKLEKIARNVADDNRIISRRYSVDMPINCPINVLYKAIKAAAHDVVSSVKMISIAPYFKNDMWYINYLFNIDYIGVQKKSLSEINRIFMNKIKILCSNKRVEEL